jgi:hypothetical protein
VSRRPHVVCALAALVVLPMVLLWPRGVRESASGPLRLDDVLRLADAHNLDVVSGRADGQLLLGHPVFLCDMPTTADDVVDLPVGDLRSPRWLGRVRFAPAQPNQFFATDTDPQRQAVWGNYWVVGDAELLRRLMVK